MRGECLGCCVGEPQALNSDRMGIVSSECKYFGVVRRLPNFVSFATDALNRQPVISANCDGCVNLITNRGVGEIGDPASRTYQVNECLDGSSFGGSVAGDVVVKCIEDKISPGCWNDIVKHSVRGQH